MNITITFPTEANTLYETSSIVDRINSLILEGDEYARVGHGRSRYEIHLTVPHTRASELCAELVDEGFLD